ncbi:MAG: hypothetical protein C4584_02360 [Armatimonadetes bacterium]|nr:MAG: hypothetical protein C4584_02360 [Armatimonadota bacterium]
MSKIIKKKYKVLDMHCSSCALLIDMELEDVAGIKSSSVSYPKQEAQVEFDGDEVKEEEIVKKVEDIGYRLVTVVN